MTDRFNGQTDVFGVGCWTTFLFYIHSHICQSLLLSYNSQNVCSKDHFSYAIYLLLPNVFCSKKPIHEVWHPLHCKKTSQRKTEWPWRLGTKSFETLKLANCDSIYNPLIYSPKAALINIFNVLHSHYSTVTRAVLINLVSSCSRQLVFSNKALIDSLHVVCLLFGQTATLPSAAEMWHTK